jgi:Uma2 family endonuclease
MPAETSPTTESRLITGDELYAMGDIGPCELVKGTIVRMAPTGDTHGACEGNLYYALRSFVNAHPLGNVRVGEVGFYIRRNPDTIRAADVLFISHERYARRSSSGYLDVVPDLVAEILSPHDRWSEVDQKLRDYFSIGVRLVWVVNPASRSVFAYRALTNVHEYAVGDDLPGEDVLPGFVLPVATIFEDI